MSTECPDVRLGVPADHDGVFKLALRLAEENAAFPVNTAKVDAVINKALAMSQGSVMGVSGPKDEEPRGFICLDMVRHWYSDVLFIADVANYVAPEYRVNSASYAKQQLRFGKKVADNFGMPFFASITSTKFTQAKMRLYEREMANCGGQFFYIPEPIRHLFEGSFQFLEPKTVRLSGRERAKVLEKIAEITHPAARAMLEEVVTGRQR